MQCKKGLLMQILPFASEETLTTLEKNIANSPSMTDLLHQGLSARDITERLLHGLGLSEAAFTMQPNYGPCEASALQQRMKRAVALLGANEIEKLLEEEGKIEVCPHIRFLQHWVWSFKAWRVRVVHLIGCTGQISRISFGSASFYAALWVVVRLL